MWWRRRTGSFHSTKSSNFTKNRHLASVCRDLSLSRPCAPVPCVWDRSLPQPCFYPKENSACHFLSGNLCLCFGVLRHTPIHFFSTPSVWTVWAPCTLPLVVVMPFWCTVDQLNCTLIQNSVSRRQVTGRLSRSKSSAFIYDGTWPGCTLKGGRLRGPCFQGIGPPIVLGGSPIQRELCSVISRRTICSSGKKNHPSRRQETL